MLSRIELEGEMIAERLRNEHAQAALQRQVAAAAPASSFTRRVARPVARALMGVGAALLRYANAEPAGRRAIELH